MKSLVKILLLSPVLSVYLEQKLDQVMTMGWDIDTSSQEIKITLKVPSKQCKISKGYCSVGLRKTMTNCDMFAAFTDSKSVTIEDYWSRNHRSPKTDKAEGGSSDYELVSSSYDSATGLVAEMKRKLQTNDEFDQDIVLDVHSQICWGYLDNRAGWHEHSDFGNPYKDSATFTWATSSGNMYFQSSSADQEQHGILMSMAWACSATLGIGVARYFKQHWWWFYVHFLCLLFTSLSTIITSAQLFKEGQFPYDSISDETFLHSRVGMILASLVVGQVVFGMASSYFKIFTKNTLMMVLMNRAHKFVGYSLFVTGLYNCWVGWDLYGSKGKALIILGFVLNVLFFVVLEILQRFFWGRMALPKASLPEMTHFKALEMVKAGKALMFADDLVVDVKHFALSHPGGSFLISESLGEDAGKYMVGCSSYDGNFNPYTHSSKAFAMLKTLAVARIPSPSGYLNISKESKSIFMTFKVKEQKPLNSNTFIIYLKNEDFQMNKQCEAPSWLGKHFMLAFKKKSNLIQRYYSSLFVDLAEWAGQLEVTSKDEVLREEGLVKFIYKVYPQGLMTEHLAELKVGDSIALKGPLGPGLLLNDLDGDFLALAGGTGLVPFIDLVHLAWRTFGDFSKSFKLSLFTFFRNQKDGFALEILEKICKKVNWLEFKVVTHANSALKDVQEEIRDKATGGVDLAWICGPSGFNRFYYQMVLKAGLEKNKVVLM
jgi:ferredoxin-NADP reductase